MKTVLRASLLAFLMVMLTGCAGEMAAMELAKQTSAIATTVLQEGKLTEFATDAKGRIQDPHYVIQAFWVTGVHLNIGLNGMFLEGEIQGTGVGDELLTSEEKESIRQSIRDAVDRGHPLAEAIKIGLDAFKGGIEELQLVDP